MREISFEACRKEEALSYKRKIILCPMQKRKKNEEFRGSRVPKGMREHKQCSDDDADDKKKSKSERLFPS